MTDADLRRAAAALVERTTKAQGLPFHVKDRSLLARAATLMKAAPPKAERHDNAA